MVIDPAPVNLHYAPMKITPKMRRYTASASMLTTAIVLSACASIATRLPDVSSAALETEKDIQQEFALKQIQSDTARLMNVAWPVIEKNAALCSKTRPAIGVKTHYIKFYDKTLKEASARVLGAQEQPTILHVIPGSPAAKAGLRVGDMLLSSNGEPARETDEKFWTQLTAGVASSVNIERDGKRQAVQVAAADICRYNIRLRSSVVINAYADGRNITVTSGMMNFTANDDELAMIVGHELAHNSMGHIRKVLSNYILSLGGTRFTRTFESEADYVGLYYQVRAGYSPENIEDFWRRLSALNPKSVARAKTHPTFPDRFLRLAATRDEIDAKQNAGAPLLPNFLSKAEAK